MATRQQIEQNKKKQAYLKANGVNVKIDGKWGRWQEQQYRRLTTRPRAYVPGILGTMSKWYDKKFGDGTTYQINPFDNGKITEDTRSDTRRWIDNQMRDPHSAIGFTVQNVAPAAAVAIPLAVGAEYLPAAGTFVKGAVSTAFNAARNPETIIPLVKETAKKAVPFVKGTVVPFLADTAKGIVGATAVNAASKATTGKTWGEQVAQSTGMPEGLGEFTNPGFVTGPFVYNTVRDIKYLFPRTKLYSDNALVNAYATLARQYNLPDKARLPYLIRRVKNDALDFTDDGNVILNGGRFRHTNFSYDRIVTPHSSGSWDKSQQTLLINPREFVKNNKFGSIEPSDMFTLQDPAEGLVVSPSDIINITANPTSTRLSTQHGVQTGKAIYTTGKDLYTQGKNLIQLPKIAQIIPFNNFDLSPSLKNGQWDMPTITQQLKNGTLKAREFLNSETRLSTYAHNKELAKRLGFGNIEEPYNSIARANKPFQPKLIANNSTEGGSFIPGKSPQQDIIEINLAHQVEPAAFHESLHRGSYGMGSLEGFDDMATFKNTRKFYEYLSDKLRKPWEQQPSSMRYYLDKPGELPVNVLELGQRMGIQIGQKYPGRAQFNAIIEQFKKANPNDGKLFVLDYLNMDKPKRVWDALSGRYFTTLPAIYGGYKITED